MKEINITEWKEIRSSGELTLVEVFSPTCLPCKMLAKELTELEKVSDIPTFKIEASILQQADKELFDQLTGVPSLLLLLQEGRIEVLPRVYARHQILEQIQNYVEGAGNTDV